MSLRPSWILHLLAAFPAEIAPFVVPIANVGQAIEALQRYDEQIAPKWSNHFTGVDFDKAPRPEYFDFSVLAPRFKPWLNALDSIRLVYRALEAHSTQYKVDFNSIYSCHGDFHFITRHGRKIYVESKSRHFTMEKSDVPGGGIIMSHVQKALGMGANIFEWKTQWQYLFTSGQGCAFLIPYGALPACWWDNTGNTLKWGTDERRQLQDFEVSLDNDLALCRSIERILERETLEPPLLQLPESIPTTAIDTPSGTDDPLGVADRMTPGTGEVFAHNAWSSAGYQRGFGSSQHPELRGETYASWAAELILEACRRRGHGLILDVGRMNGNFRFLVTRYRWSNYDKHNYDHYGDAPARVWQMPKLKPVVSVNFLRVEWSDDLAPTVGSRNTAWALPRILDRKPSIVICDAYPYSCARFPHNRFLVPSEILPEVVDRGSIFRLKRGLLDDYTVDSDRLLDRILRILRGNEKTALGLDSVAIDSKKYIHSLKDVLQDSLLFQNDNDVHDVEE